MTTKNKKYCFRDSDFPQNGYVAIVYTKTNDGFRFFYPLQTFFISTNFLRDEVKLFKQKIEGEGKMKIHGVIVVKIKFNKTFPLKKEYWNTDKKSPLETDFRIKKIF